jgi:hypothetical protein
MPLAILLQEQLSILTKGVQKVDRWQAVTETFSRVVDRLRSAYLVRWFGTPLPTAGLELKVAFANMDELRKRWNAIGAGRRTETPAIGPNLTEPLLGAGGTLVGIFASPLHGILLGLAAGSLIDRWYVQAYAVANWLTAGLLGSGAFGLVGVLGGVGLLWGLAAWAISGQPRGAFDLLGAIAELAVPLQRFWEQVTGPRSAVRNPLLREILLLGDRVAGLVVLLLGAFAILVTRVGPLLDPMRAGILATAALAKELWGLVAFVVGQTVGLLQGLLSGPASVPRLLSAVISGLTRVFKRIGAGLRGVWATISGAFAGFGRWAAVLLAFWSMQALPFARAHTIDHPTVRYVRSFLGQLSVASAWRARTKSASPPTPSAGSPGMMSKLGSWFVGQLVIPTTTPTLPTIPTAPRLLSLRLIGPIAEATASVPALVPNPLALGTEGTAVLRRAQRPPSVFAREWAALRAAAREPEGFARALETRTYLGVVERIVSPAAAEAVRGLEDVLGRLDESIQTGLGRHPVRDLPEPTELAPVIRKLRVRARGVAPDTLRTWADDLRAALSAEPYPVPAEG